MASERVEDMMTSEEVEDMMASDVEDSQKLEDEVTSEEVKDEMGRYSGGHGKQLWSLIHTLCEVELFDQYHVGTEDARLDS